MLAIAGNAIAIDMAQVNKQTCFIYNMATGRIWDAYYHRNAGKIKSRAGQPLTSFMLNAHGYSEPDRCEIRGENFHCKVTPCH